MFDFVDSLCVIVSIYVFVCGKQGPQALLGLRLVTFSVNWDILFSLHSVGHYLLASVAK